MTFRFAILGFFAALALLVLQACSVSTPSMSGIRDSKLFDRRIKETPRQKVIRECQQEAERFRVNCKHCHTTDKLDEISAEKLELNDVGVRAQIMRKSPSFGLNQDCSSCHQTKFKLNRNAEKLFGPGGKKYEEAQKALKPDV
ncbi:MAG TPA: hypothetical protein VEJ63_23995 [Planctomycetota bacterium]|nr:hypothetical protein [Planctomycetota bacterium]